MGASIELVVYFIISYHINFPVPGMGYILLNHWAKCSHRPTQTLEAIANVMGYPMIRFYY